MISGLLSLVFVYQQNGNKFLKLFLICRENNFALARLTLEALLIGSVFGNRQTRPLSHDLLTSNGGAIVKWSSNRMLRQLSGR